MLAPSTANASALSLAWVAGLVDGEGCIDCRSHVPRRQRHLPRLAVSNTYRPALERVREVLGVGAISSQANPNRPLWRWEVSGAAGVGAACAALLPYLVIKREQAVVMIALCERFTAGGRRLDDAELTERSRLADELRRLKVAYNDRGGAPRPREPLPL